MLLVGGFNPSETDARQIGSSPQIKNKNKKYSKPPPTAILGGSSHLVNSKQLEKCKSSVPEVVFTPSKWPFHRLLNGSYQLPLDPKTMKNEGFKPFKYGL